MAKAAITAIGTTVASTPIVPLLESGFYMDRYLFNNYKRIQGNWPLLKLKLKTAIIVNAVAYGGAMAGMVVGKSFESMAGPIGAVAGAGLGVPQLVHLSRGFFERMTIK